MVDLLIREVVLLLGDTISVHSASFHPSVQVVLSNLMLVKGMAGGGGGSKPWPASHPSGE